MNEILKPTYRGKKMKSFSEMVGPIDSKRLFLEASKFAGIIARRSTEKKSAWGPIKKGLGPLVGL